MRILTYTVLPELAGRTVKYCLRRQFTLTDGMISSLKWRPGAITLNGTPVRTNAIVQAGDILAVEVGDVKPGGEFVPVEVPLDILYEDADLLILNKPAGLAVHGKSEKGDITLGNALAFRYGPDTLFHPVNRLDKDTSGAMVVAKNGYIHDRLRRVLHTGEFRREYLAVVVGQPNPPAGVINAPIGKSGEGWKREVRPDGQSAVTEYETVKTWEELSLLRLTLQTGRTHQIRVHMAHLGHPLLGDWLYGARDDRIPRHALHASRVVLCHPVTGRLVDVSAPLPEDLKKLI